MPPSDVLYGDVAETMPELGLLQVDDLDRMALAAAMLAHDPADQPIGRPVKLLKDRAALRLRW